MKLEEITEVCKANPALPRILADAFGHEIPLGKLSLNPNRIIDSSFLCKTLEEYREISGTNARFDREEKVEKRIPSLFVIWLDGTVEKSTEVAYRCVGTTNDDWTNELVYSGEMEWDDEATKPIAHQFVNRPDVHYVVKLEKCTHSWVGEKETIDSLSITLFFPSPDVDIQATAVAIMSHWNEYGDTSDFGSEEENE